MSDASEPLSRSDRLFEDPARIDCSKNMCTVTLHFCTASLRSALHRAWICTGSHYIYIYIIYTENAKSIFGKNIHWFVKKLAPLLLAELLGFGTESDITRLSYSGFAEKVYPSKANCEA